MVNHQCGVRSSEVIPVFVFHVLTIRTLDLQGDSRKRDRSDREDGDGGAFLLSSHSCRANLQAEVPLREILLPPDVVQASKKIRVAPFPVEQSP